MIRQHVQCRSHEHRTQHSLTTTKTGSANRTCHRAALRSVSDSSTTAIPKHQMPEQGGVALTGAVAPFWLSFPNFVPDSTAPFEREFTRLARIEGWHATQKKGQLTGAVASELASMSGGVGALEQWKSLCRVVGITEELASITQCRKVNSHQHQPCSHCRGLMHSRPCAQSSSTCST